jgi:hypothetical protein
MAMDIEAEIRDLKRRGKLEGSFGFLVREIQDFHKDLLKFETKTEQRFKHIDGRFDRLENKLDRLDREIDGEIDGLTTALRGIIVEAVREAYREQNKKR